MFHNYHRNQSSKSVNSWDFENFDNVMFPVVLSGMSNITPYVEQSICLVGYHVIYLLHCSFRHGNHYI